MRKLSIKGEWQPCQPVNLSALMLMIDVHVMPQCDNVSAEYQERLPALSASQFVSVQSTSTLGRDIIAAVRKIDGFGDLTDEAVDDASRRLDGKIVGLALLKRAEGRL